MDGAIVLSILDFSLQNHQLWRRRMGNGHGKKKRKSKLGTNPELETFPDVPKITQPPALNIRSGPQCEIEHFINWIKSDTTVSAFYNKITNNETTFLCDINHPTRIKGTTLLHMACEAQNLPLVKTLIHAGAHVNARVRTVKYCTPLDIALKHHNPGLIQFLISCGGYTVNGISTWLKATDGPGMDTPEVHEDGKIEKILFIREYLLKHSIQDYRPNFYASTNWHQDFLNAVLNNRVGFAKEILENTDIDVNGYHAFMPYHSDNLITPIHTAAINGCLPMVKLLVEHGALIIEDDWGVTTSEMARRNNHPDIADFLEKTQRDRYKRLKSHAELPKKYQLILLGLFADKNSTLNALGKHSDVAKVITQNAFTMEYCTDTQGRLIR